MADAADDSEGHLPEGFDPIPPEPFGKYTLVARVGVGGMATVYLAIAAGPAGFRKLVVVKRLLSHLESDPGFVGMFLDEARLAARLNHPNVVQTLEVGARDDQHFLAMEYLEGQTFARLMGRFRRLEKPMPAPIVAHVGSELLEGLSYAHGLEDFDGSPLGVVHRDISPTNIMITYAGVVKLLDFGIARATTQDSHTDPEQRKGKYAYIAPEQARETFDARADLFSLGIVLWEAIAGKRLFLADNPAQTLKKTMSMPIPPLSRVVRQPLPRGLEGVVARALARDPDQRYQSAREMQVALDEVMRSAKGIVRKSDVQKFMAKVFEDVRASHGRALKHCVEMGLDSATAMMEVLDPLATPRLLQEGDGVALDDDSGSSPTSGAGPRLTAWWAGRSRAARWSGGAAAAGVLATLAIVSVGDGGGADRPDETVPVARAAPAERGGTEVVEAPDVEAPDVEPAPAATAEDAEPDAPLRDLAVFEREREAGLEHFRERRFEEAAASYRAAAYHNPAHAGVHAALAASLFELGDHEGAISAYQEAVRLAPTSDGYHAALGRCYAEAGRPDLAEESYRQALRLDRRNRAARRGLRRLRRQR